MATYTIAFADDHLILCGPDGPETESALQARLKWAGRYAPDSVEGLKIERGLTLTNDPMGLWDYVAFNSDDYARIVRDDESGEESYLYEDSEIQRGLLRDESGRYFRYAMWTPDCGEGFDSAENRQEAIVRWLSKSKYASQSTGCGDFSVFQGQRVLFWDLESVELFDWLKKEGITGGKTIGGYSIRHFDGAWGMRGLAKQELVFLSNSIPSSLSEGLVDEEARHAIPEEEEPSSLVTSAAMGGPDDREHEPVPEYEGDLPDDVPDPELELPDALNEAADEAAQQWMNGLRREAIVKWLADSKFVKQLAKASQEYEGLFVHKGGLVRLKDGTVREILDWLEHEGVRDGMSIGGYTVVYSKPDGPHGENQTFFGMICDAPFLPGDPLEQEKKTGNLDDDIPF